MNTFSSFRKFFLFALLNLLIFPFLSSGVSALSFPKNTLPSRVEGMQATLRDDGVLLSWKPSTSSVEYPVSDYVVQYRTGIIRIFRTYKDPVNSEPSIFLKNLVPNKAYYFRIAAKNKKGTLSRYSSVVKITLPKKQIVAGVPTAPLNLVAVGGNAQASIQFNSPSSSGKSPILYYTLTSTPEGKTFKYTPTSTGATSFSVQFAGLTNGKTYTFHATATNAQGTSKLSIASNSVLVQGAVPPVGGGGGGGGGGGYTPPPTYTYSWSLGSWGACSLSCGGGTQNRTVECRRNDGVLASDSSCTTTKPLTSQSCNTQACASSGSTDTTAPSIPANLTATGTSSSQINLSWSASTDAVGVIGYRIYRNGQLTGTASTTSYQNTGLSTSTQYSFTVRAYDAAGNVSADSTSVNATTQAPSVATGGTILGLTIPSGHPRIWWNTERLNRARTWYSSNPFTPSSSNARDLALHCLISGVTTYCQQAVNYAMDTLCTNAACTNPDPSIGVAADHLRWYGEDVILIYDWLYDYFTPTQRQTLIDRWNGYFSNVRQRTWGAPSMYQSNYNWGYMRNEIEWGIATWGENSQAETNIRYGLETRWMNNFVPHAGATPGGRGGMFHEGSNYGASIAGDSIVPFIGASLLGRDIYSNDSNYFKEAVMYIIYSTTPEPTWQPGLAQPTYELFPFADDERFWEGGYTTTRGGYANFMLTASNHWSVIALGEYAKAWYSKVSATADRFVRSVDTGTTAGNLANLPLDYYVPGAQYFFGKTSWNIPSTAFVWQMGRTMDEGHRHNDVGTWQFWRGGRWLSRETTGYSEQITGYNNSGTVDTNHAVGHNSLLINGRGPVAYEELGPSVTRRLESRDDYAYAAVNLRPVYRSDHYYYENTAVQSIEREFLFLRGLETMLIFDRVGTTSPGDTKTFLAHFEANPTVNSGGREVSYTSGNQSVYLKTLLPASLNYRIVNEAGNHGQYRLELETSGQTETYFLNVLQARGSSEANVSASVVDNGTSYTVSLSHPTKGTASVTLNKGMASAGGSLTVGSNNHTLTSSVQNITVTDNGPVWQ